MSTASKRPYSRARGGSIHPLTAHIPASATVRSVRSTRVSETPCPRSPLPFDRPRSQRALKRVLAVVAAVCVGGLAAGVGPALATFPGQNGKIVFTTSTDDDGTADIYTMSPNGRHLLNLTPDSPANDDFPSWSADGRMIAFWSTRTGPDNPTGDQEIFVMNADGSGLRQVTDNTVDDGAPAWSPNGHRLVFHRWLPDDGDQADLVTVRVNGTGERNLTRSPGIVDRHAGLVAGRARDRVHRATTAGSEQRHLHDPPGRLPPAGTDRHAHRRGVSGLVP